MSQKTQESDVFATVFTATYNRAYILPKLYESLKAQTAAPRFEWVIVDDGSTDGTGELVSAWREDASLGFRIRYFYQENAGKQAAWNRGLAEASGLLFFPVDSDDHLVPDAIEHLAKMVERVGEGDGQIIGVSGVRAFPGGKLTGGSLLEAGDFLDFAPRERISQGITGDLAEAFFTEKLRRYPFPVFQGEKFVPEAVVFNRFTEDGMRLRGFPYPLVCSEYLPDGYTKNMDRLLVRNWKGYSLYIRELMAGHASLKAKVVPLCGYLYRCVLKALHVYR